MTGPSWDQEQELLRELPCNHIFHHRCLDSGTAKHSNAAVRLGSFRFRDDECELVSVRFGSLRKQS